MKRILIPFLFFITTFLNAQTMAVLFENPSPWTSLSINGNYLYVGSFGDGKIYKADIMQLNPTPELFFTGVAGIEGMYCKDNFLYAALRPAASQGGLHRVVRIDLTQDVPVIEQIAEMTFARGITIAGNDLYTHAGSKIYKTDLSTTAFTTTELINDLEFAYGGKGMVIINDYLYTSDNNKLVKYNLANANPLREVVSTVTAINEISGLAPDLESDNYIYAVDSNHFYRINLNDGSAVLSLSTIPSCYNNNIFNLNNVIYVSDGEGGTIYTIDMNTLSTPVFEKEKIKLYPVPSNDFIHCENCGILSVKDISGKSFDVKTDGLKFDVAALPNGIYFVEIKSNEKIYYQKIIKN